MARIDDVDMRLCCVFLRVFMVQYNACGVASNSNSIRFNAFAVAYQWSTNKYAFIPDMAMDLFVHTTSRASVRFRRMSIKCERSVDCALVSNTINKPTCPRSWQFPICLHIKSGTISHWFEPKIRWLQKHKANNVQHYSGRTTPTSHTTTQKHARILRADDFIHTHIQHSDGRINHMLLCVRTMETSAHFNHSVTRQKKNVYPSVRHTA